MEPRYTIGLDLGKLSDFSALVVMESTLIETSQPGVLIPRHDCRTLKRWPLGTSYTAVVREVAGLVANLDAIYPSLVVDATGVGLPVVDMIRQEALPVTLVPVMITAGSSEGYHNGSHHVAKIILVATLQVLLQQRRLRFAHSMPEVSILLREMQNYQVKITAAANEVFDARSGTHDDLVLALALAAWDAERVRPFEAPTVLPDLHRTSSRDNPNSPFYRRSRTEFRFRKQRWE